MQLVSKYKLPKYVTFTVERQNIFNLIVQDNHSMKLGCINISSIDVCVSLILKLHPPAKTYTCAPVLNKSSFMEKSFLDHFEHILRNFQNFTWYCFWGQIFVIRHVLSKSLETLHKLLNSSSFGMKNNFESLGTLDNFTCVPCDTPYGIWGHDMIS